ncbi:Calx-beta domain-containing protein [Paenibacillus sp. 1A_MP2]|uniref:Calx-beta domain-containing protein n=1 Tax=Paenibacillus sp. 1A_MP2 TaxID=3457495 RepID=UPI003FCD5F66
MERDGLDDIAYASTNTIHFLNSRAEGELGFDNPSYSVNEHKGEVTVTVSRSGSSYGQTKVRLRTVEGTAIAGIDFTSVDDMIEFNAGEISKSYTIQILDNNSYSGDRSFSVTLSNPTNEATLGNQTIATVTINEDESPPDVTAPTLIQRNFPL